MELITGFWQYLIIFILSAVLIYGILRHMLSISPHGSSANAIPNAKRRYFFWEVYHSPKLQRFLAANSFKEANQLLLQANFRSPNRMIYFYLVKFLLLAMGCFAVVMFADLMPQSIISFVIILPVFIFLWFLPEMILKKIKIAYQFKVKSGMQIFLELLIICLDVGYSIEDSFKLLSKTLAFDRPELAFELAHTAEDLRLQQNRQLAWQNLKMRTDFTEIHSLIRTLQQHEDTGTSLKLSLHKQAEHMRKVRFSDAEKRAAKIPSFLATIVGLIYFPIILLIVAVPLLLYTNQLVNAFF